jgi:antitoxin (DNA-binding transcriptional repressor) of toxin-antitoxin stability system
MEVFMVKVALSEFKAKMSYYLRLVKSGEELELQERGFRVACVSSQEIEKDLEIFAPQKSPKKLAEMKFSVKVNGDIDVVRLLTEDRSRR